jgi:transposase, IS30 family
MKRRYKQLTLEQRSQIHALKARGDSCKQIALFVKVHASTVVRELQRNATPHGYCPTQAQQKTHTRRRQRQGGYRKTPTTVWDLVVDKLTNQQWSPSQISGWLALEHGIKLSHECIYQYVYAIKKAGGKLHSQLRRQGKRYQKRINGRTNRGRIIGRIDISERPKIVEDKSRLGDWEGDTIVGLGHQSAVVTLVERQTGFLKMAVVEKNTAENVTNAVLALLEPMKDKVHTITFDNGKEFSYHYKLQAPLQADIYFATPYHSWERGLNENTNGLIRQYFPKKTDFATITPEQIQAVEDKLNNRPRKRHGYKTPNQAMRLAA